MTCIDTKDLRGMPHVVRAMEAIVLEGANALILGPPGIGKTMVARRFPTIMRPLSKLQRGELYETYRLARLMKEGGLVPETPPFRAPHHSISTAALCGNIKRQSGELQLARHGVLYLDELDEFRPDSIHQLRCHQDFDDTMLVASASRCPCGWFDWFESQRRECTCTGAAITRHLGRLKKKTLHLKINHTILIESKSHKSFVNAEPGESSETIRNRIISTEPHAPGSHIVWGSGEQP